MEENQINTPQNEELFEDSTVFSAPKEHKKTKKSNKYKRLIALISVFLVVGIIATTVIGITKNWEIFGWVPKKKEEKNQTQLQNMQNIQNKALTFDTYAYEKITIINNKATLVLQADMVEDNKGNLNQVWSLEGYDKNLIDSISLSQIASYTKNIQYFDAYDYNESVEKEKYGFNQPFLTVKVETGEPTADYTLTYGNRTIDDNYIYLLVSKEPTKVYLANSGITSGFLVEPLDLAVNKAVPIVEKNNKNAAYFDEEGKLCDFDSITVSGNYFPNKMVFTPNKNKKFSTYATYICTAPKLRIADGIVEDIRDTFSNGISASSVVSFDKSAKSLKKFGLDDPDAVFTIRIAGKNYSYSLKATDKSKTQFYVTSDNDPLIRTATITNMNFVTYEEKDFYLGFMALESIGDVSEFSMSGEVNTAFSIKKDEINSTYIIENGGKSVVANDFQTYYANFIGTMAVDFNVVKTSGKPDLTITMKHVNGSAPTVLTFHKISESRYQYAVGSIPMGQISSTSYSKLVRDINKLIP